MANAAPPSSEIFWLPSLRHRAEARIGALKRDALALWLAARDPRTPIAAKLLAGAVAAYAFSPIDLLPDFIPVIGLLDDALIVPLGIWLAVKIIPAPLMDELREDAGRLAQRPVSRTAALTIVTIWLAAIAATGWYFLR